MKNRYIALTIGPVFNTMASVRSTKALWAASYLFSWIMREILKDLRTRKSDIELLNLPNNDDLFSGKKGVGLFADRFTAKLIGTNFDLITLQKVVQPVIKTLADKMCKDINNKVAAHTGNVSPTKYTAGEIETYLTDYFRLQAIEFELDVTDNNPVKTADDYLNSLELRSVGPSVQGIDYLNIFLEDTFYNFFIEDEFDKRGFPSTLEIATASLRHYDTKAYDEAVTKLQPNKKDDENALKEDKKQPYFIKSIQNIDKDKFRLCHKYIAIVRADGDYIGHLFKTLLALDAELPMPDEKNRSRAQQLADALADFSLAASEIVKQSGGVPVFAGGDDLLFFAPVSIETEAGGKWERSHIFDLIQKIDGLFEDKVIKCGTIDEHIKEKLGDKRPTMSYGVSISHHKYPLAESLALAQELLFEKIKSKKELRNSIAWRVTKHSGMGFGMLIQKGKTLGPKILNFFSTNKLGQEERKSSFLASVMHKLGSLEGLFQATAHAPRDHFKNIVFNNFNESVHRQEILIDGQKSKVLSPFLEEVTEILIQCFEGNKCFPSLNNEDKNKIVQENLEQAYSLLRFVHFLETKDKD